MLVEDANYIHNMNNCSEAHWNHFNCGPEQRITKCTGQNHVNRKFICVKEDIEGIYDSTNNNYGNKILMF